MPNHAKTFAVIGMGREARSHYEGYGRSLCRPEFEVRTYQRAEAESAVMRIDESEVQMGTESDSDEAAYIR